MPKINRKLPALSLLEILLVLAIIGIFMTLALPKLMGVVGDARAAEAQQQLNFVHTLQKSYYFKKAKYTANLDDIDFEQDKLVPDGGNAFYKIEIVSASQGAYEARANAVVDFDGDGQKNVWSIDQDKNLKEIVKD